MSNNSLHQLYAEHTGKVSDKWSLYLSEYDRLFKDYRDKPIRLLEIGIQNGGSLEIWSKFFNNASVLIGCDINPDCKLLNYDDSRIEIIIGDANSAEVCERLSQLSPQFDIIIDDGSHLSRDIIKSFALYFPTIVDGGIYIVEDLHCSYWVNLEGGLFDPYSSISFFKRLADVINHEHWGIPKARSDILLGIFTKYGCSVNPEVLTQVHSVEFINSMCVIRKAPAQDNSLGRRVIAGLTELVVSGHTDLHDRSYQLDPINDQSKNPWATRTTPPDEVIQFTEQLLFKAQLQIASLHQALGDLEEKNTNLCQNLCELKELTANLGQTVKDFQNSTSWRLTIPIRFIVINIKHIKKILFAFAILILNFKIIIKFSSKSLAHIEHYLTLLQDPEYAAQFSRDRGLSPELIRALIIIGVTILKIKQWWFSIKLNKKYSQYLDSFFQGKSSELKKNVPSHLGFHIDKPNVFFKIVDDSFIVSGWAVDLNIKSAAKVRVRIGKVEQQLYESPREDVQKIFAKICALPLDVGFVASPSLSIGLHRMWIDVQGSDQIWIPIHRTLLFRKPSNWLKELKQVLSYISWTSIEQNQLNAEITEIEKHIYLMIHKPIFTVIIDTRQGLTDWKDSLKSVRKQIYTNYEVFILINTSTDVPFILEQDVKPLLETTLADVSGDFIVFIKNGQQLSRNALYEFANTVNQYPDIDLVYGDEDYLNDSGERCNPFHKPDWSPDYLETFNYIGFPACFRTSIARGCFHNTYLYDLVLRFTERTTKIFHISKILGHGVLNERDEEAVENATAKDIVSLQERINRTKRQGIVREHELHRGCYDIELRLRHEPLVSIIIPTAGKTVTLGERQIDLISNVIEQIRNRSTYKNIEIIVVDNGDLSECQEKALVNHGSQRITYTESVFNISKKLNLGASIANGELLLLMNDDIEIITPTWIERMIEHFEKPHVGVVGAKLLYPDRRTQHVGVVHNDGNPDHVRRLYPRDEAGYFFGTCGVRNFMAVTGAVMMTLTNIYHSVCGYSEELAVSYNDTDFCLKVREIGFSIVYASRVELIHMESQSRVPSADIREVMWYQKRWATHVTSDPYYNEQFLTVAPPTFVPHINLRKI